MFRRRYRPVDDDDPSLLTALVVLIWPLCIPLMWCADVVSKGLRKRKNSADDDFAAALHRHSATTELARMRGTADFVLETVDVVVVGFHTFESVDLLHAAATGKHIRIIVLQQRAKETTEQRLARSCTVLKWAF